jgi:hypothetical protein
MNYGRLIALAGAAIIASVSPLLAGTSAASAAAAPGTTVTVGSCTLTVTIHEDRNSNGAYVDAHVDADSCYIGVEGAIMGPSGTPVSFGGDVHYAGDDSVTGYIPINSGNHHGFRFWYDNMWNYEWID